ncbi:uncharacterized protein PFL1_02686 [Pseudozyma flocculosa PF-1]|uniref:Uncharacterized protein n=1 Tax=Pseudozyma flocculosa PF-1 TaxID=1277687 RepID=A0A061HBT8_9BASI|nr:uncharacterized protein PFL1_02686 [Pseudozyma flocculosa PF-1]EPQ30013.1 hypothetical protein PFL1_02686 [Pseudozyma flocculosa PF-1]
MSELGPATVPRPLADQVSLLPVAYEREDTTLERANGATQVPTPQPSLLRSMEPPRLASLRRTEAPDVPLYRYRTATPGGDPACSDTPMTLAPLPGPLALPCRSAPRPRPAMSAGEGLHTTTSAPDRPRSYPPVPWQAHDLPSQPASSRCRRGCEAKDTARF